MLKIIGIGGAATLAVLAAPEAVQTVTNSERAWYLVMMATTPVVMTIACTLAGLWGKSVLQKISDQGADMKGLRADLRDNSKATTDALIQLAEVKTAVQYTQRTIEHLTASQHPVPRP